MEITPSPAQATSLSALILAGGRSSRMGRDKALITIRGIPLIRQTYNVASACTSTIYTVTPWPERYKAVLPDACQFLQETVVKAGESSGPLIGFAQGLTHIGTEWVLLLACDLPRLQPEFLQVWTGQLAEVSEDVIALLPRQNHGWEPLCGFYRSRCLKSLQAFIDSGGRAFQPWLAQQSVQALPVPNPHLLLNCNSPEDLAAALED